MTYQTIAKIMKDKKVDTITIYDFDNEEVA
jgi:hypothetical protein